MNVIEGSATKGIKLRFSGILGEQKNDFYVFTYIFEILGHFFKTHFLISFKNNFFFRRFL